MVNGAPMSRTRRPCRLAGIRYGSEQGSPSSLDAQTLSRMRIETQVSYYPNPDVFMRFSVSLSG